ncbi:MAG: hypothetical protein LKM36_09640 [Flavobacteriales bacterium]|jgi:hypothetical protein|nr:hypothetical protein [Flavobacteriales bacterium]
MTTKAQYPVPIATAVKLFCTFLAGVMVALAQPVRAQGNDKQLRAQADVLFNQGEYYKALPLYSQLVSLSPADHDLNYKLGTCSIYGKEEKAKAVGFLKYAVQGPSTAPLAWYFLGRAYQLDYRFDDAVEAYRHFSGTADKKTLDAHPVEALQQQCRNAKFLLANIKDIDVLNKVEVDAADFFRFYDLGNIGGKIVVTPDELLTPYDRKSGERFLTYLPDGGGPVYFSSYGKNGATGRDIYRCDLLPSSTFSTPVRLAGYVNTDQDEDYAVMGQDRKTFYFCSKGHNSMGGYDVFKCAYDPGMDVFGTPENLDFAVNTPADELLYITDSEGKQACFASDRDSRQGMVNVYRVGTEQAPINITVLQGVFASNVAPTDRKARIFVEDMLTHERVAEVATDDSGKYLVALPRGGQYQFKVETGANGNKLLATVDIPNSDAAVAYRQELRVTGASGEKLEVTNHFDEPLAGDVFAMAMDEIKRRAKLDVTSQRMQPLAVSVPTNTGDPLVQAGFANNTLPQVKAMAQEEARQRKSEADKQTAQSDRSYELALNSVELAEIGHSTAKDLVQQAATVNDPVAAERLLYRAAEARQQADDANLRAKAAYGAARDLDSTARIATQEAQQAATVANAVDQGISSGNTANLTDALKRLKTAVDARSGPNARLENAERMRREASEATTAAGKKVPVALAARKEESDFVERVNAQKRFAEASKGSKKENAERQLGDMQVQLAALHEEADDAFAKARTAEEEAAAARGKAELAKYLAENPVTQGAPPPSDQVTMLASRISRVQSANAGLAIPEEYRPVASETAEQRQQRLFDWGTAMQSTGELSAATTARSAGQGDGASAGTVANPMAAKPASSQGNDLAGITSGSEPVANSAEVGKPDGNAAGATGDKAVTAPERDPSKAVAPTQTADMAVSTPSTATTPKTEGTEVTTPSASSTADPTQDANDAVTGTETSVAATTIGSGTEAGLSSVLDKEEQAFFAANALAELQQLRGSAPDRKTRDSLDVAIAAKRAELKAAATEADLAATDVAAKQQERTVAGSQTSGAENVQSPNNGSNAAVAVPTGISAPAEEQVEEDLAQQAGTTSTGTESTDQAAPVPETVAQLVEEGKDLVPAGANTAAANKLDSAALAIETPANADVASVGTERRVNGGGNGSSTTIAQEGSGTITSKEPDDQVASATKMGSDGGEPTPPASATQDTGLPTTVNTDGTNAAGIMKDGATSQVAVEPGAVNGANPQGSKEVAANIPAETATGMQYVELAFDPALLYPDIAEELVPGISVQYQQAQAGEGSAKAKEAVFQVLQQQLMDSIDARSARQTAYLETNPETSVLILPQLDRLRSLKGAVQGAPETGLAQVLTVTDATLATATPGSMGQEDSSTLRTTGFLAPAASDHARSYVDLGPDIEHVYETRIAYRAKDVGQEVAAKANDVSDIRALRAAIDSMEAVIKDTPASAVYDKLRTDTDKRIDDLLIRQTDMGQRLDFISRREYQTALDSTRLLQAAMSRKGLSSSTPLRQMAQEFEASAKSAMDDAAGFRKEGDRSKDIVDRDSYFRQAWAANIKAFKLMDQSHTVRNYLMQEGVNTKETITYAEVVKRMFGEEELQVAQERSVVQETAPERVTVMPENVPVVEEAPRVKEESTPAMAIVPAVAVENTPVPAQVPAAEPSAPVAVVPAEVVVEQPAPAPATPELVAEKALATATVVEPLPAYLDKHYDLGERTKDSLLKDAEARVYFMLRGSAMEHADSAKWALADAEAMATRAQQLKRGAGGSGQVGVADEAARLQSSSDSLRMVSLKQGHEAALDNAAAEHLMSGLSVERSGSISAMELKNRHSAAIAAALPTPEVRQAEPVVVPAVTTPVESAAVETVSVPAERPKADIPVITAPVPAAPEPKVLAPLVADNFQVKAEAVRATPIPVDAPMPQGVVYKVQVGAFRNELPKDAFSDMTPVTGESVGNGLTRYAAGQFTSAQSAAKAGETVRARGYRDAFVVAYLDGNRVSLREAIAAERAAARTGTLAVAQPSGSSATPVPSGQTATPAVTAPEPENAGGEDAAVLRKYPTSVQEVLAEFKPNAAATEYYNDPTAAPAKQVETVKGLFFTVQVGVYSKPTALDRLFNISPLNSERTETNKIRYTTGVYQDPGTANTRKNATVLLGVKDAYVTAYLNGKRIPLGEGRALLAKFGPSILADPAGR